jgi:X-X-X-Leu-X-X-Gly heptad repeat protein
MPELNLRNLRRDFRLPELRLPEMSRDDIAKGLGEARKELRDVRKDLQEFRRDFEMPKVDVTIDEAPRLDVAKVVDAGKDAAKQVADGATQMADGAKQGVVQAAQAAGLMKTPATGRSRRPFIVAGAVTLGVLGFALLNSPAMKARLRDSAQRARERMAARRSAWDIDDETTAFDAARPAGVEPSKYSGTIDSSGSPFAEPPTELPEGLGSEGDVHQIEEDAAARA